MNSVDIFEKRLREEIAAVEKEIKSHNQEVEALNKRLEGLKRADELFESDQAAIAELLQASIGNGERYHSRDSKRTSRHERRPTRRQPAPKKATRPHHWKYTESKVTALLYTNLTR